MAQPAARQWYEPEPHALRAVEEANRLRDKENRLRDSAHEWRSEGRHHSMWLLLSFIVAVALFLPFRAGWVDVDGGHWALLWFVGIGASYFAAERVGKWRAARILNRLDRRGRR